MKNQSMLLEIDYSKNYELKLMDDSKWSVNPMDLPTVTVWLPTSTIIIEEVNDGSMYNCKLTNSNSKNSVRAMKVK